MARKILSLLLSVCLSLSGCHDPARVTPGAPSDSKAGTPSGPAAPASVAPKGIIAVTFREEAGLDAFDWVRNATGGGMEGFTPGGSGGDAISGLLVLSIVLVLLMVALTKTGIDTIAGKMEQKKWKPCEDKVRAAVGTIDLHSLASEALLKNLRSSGENSVVLLTNDGPSPFEQGAKSGADWLLKIDIGKLSWQYTKKGLYLGARVKAGLWDIRTRSYSKSWSFDSGPDSQSQPLAILCQGDTNRLVKEEIARLYTGLVRRIARFPAISPPSPDTSDEPTKRTQDEFQRNPG